MPATLCRTKSQLSVRQSSVLLDSCLVMINVKSIDDELVHWDCSGKRLLLLSIHLRVYWIERSFFAVNSIVKNDGVISLLWNKWWSKGNSKRMNVSISSRLSSEIFRHMSTVWYSREVAWRFRWRVDWYPSHERMLPGRISLERYGIIPNDTEREDEAWNECFLQWEELTSEKVEASTNSCELSHMSVKPTNSPVKMIHRGSSLIEN